MMQHNFSRAIAPRFRFSNPTDAVLSGTGSPLVDNGFAPAHIDMQQLMPSAEIVGTEGDDSLEGTTQDDTISGLGGNDVIRGRGGDDAIGGGLGNDLLYGDEGNDRLVAGLGDDNLFGGTGDDILEGTLEPERGAVQRSFLYGEAGNDSLYLEPTSFAFGSGLRETFAAGGIGDDIYYARYADQTRIFENVGEGNDLIVLIPRLTPGQAPIFYMPANVESLSVVLGGSTGSTVIGNALDNFIDGNGILGGAQTSIGNDLFLGGAGNDNLFGREGDDTLFGEAGDDRLFGGTGLDYLIGGDGNDELAGNSGAGEADALYGGIGNDTYVVDSAADLIFENPGEGTDFVNVQMSGGGYYMFANIENMELGETTLFGVGNELDNRIVSLNSAQTVLGGAGNDTVFGNGGNDIIFGEAGNDTVNAGSGIDYVAGGDGDDSLVGDEGADALYGEGGNDSLIGGSDFATDILSGGDGNDRLNGDSGLGDFDFLYGGAGDDEYRVDTSADLVFEDVGGGRDVVIANIPNGGFYLYDNIENMSLAGTTLFGVGNALDNSIFGNGGTNLLLGGIGNDSLYGRGGDDVVYGEDGNDILDGEAGNDFLIGGAGNDVFLGSAGNDISRGEAGRDVFVMQLGNQGEYVQDFTRGEDRVELVGLGITSFAQLQALMTQSGSDTVINFGGGDFMVLQNITATTLTGADFGF